MTSGFSFIRKLSAKGVISFYLIKSPAAAIHILTRISNETVFNVPSTPVDLAVAQVLGAPFPFEFLNKQNGANLFPMPKCNGVRLEEATIDQLQEAMNTGLLTTSQIVLCYMQRIYQTDMYLEYDFSFFFFLAAYYFHRKSRSRLTTEVPSWSSTPTSCRLPPL